MVKDGNYRRNREKNEREQLTGCLHKHIVIEGTHFDLSGLADDAGQPVELIHKGFELIHCQLGAVTTALRAQTAAADTNGETVMV